MPTHSSRNRLGIDSTDTRETLMTGFSTGHGIRRAPERRRPRSAAARGLMAVAASTLFTLGVTGMADEKPIRITSLSVSAGRVDPGDSVTLKVAFTGPANLGIRQAIGGEGCIPGWELHGKGYAFMPGNDFPTDQGLKTPTHFHRDNGALDQDPRMGHWEVTIDTAGWEEGTYSLGIMASNRPKLGPFKGDLKACQLIVGEPLPLTADDGSLAGVTIAINGARLDGRNPEATVVPGRPNQMTVGVAPEVLSETGLKAELRRILPRECKRSDTLASQTARLTSRDAVVSFDLGIFAVPSDFDFTGGRLRHRGTRFVLTLTRADGSLKGQITFGHTIGQTSRRDVLRAGAAGWLYHLGFRGGGPKALDPPVLLSLDPIALAEPGTNILRVRLRSDIPAVDEEVATLRGEVTVHASGLRPSWRKALTISTRVTQLPLPEEQVTDSPPLVVSFVPAVDGSADRSGPSLTIRATAVNPARVQVSPLAPWSLERDPSRPIIRITDFGREVAEKRLFIADGSGWTVEGEENDAALVHPAGDWQAAPARLNVPTANGWFAVYAEARKGWTMLQIGNGLVRGVRLGPTFVDAADLREQDIRIYPVDLPGAGLKSLRLVPVTRTSVDAWRRHVAAPDKVLRGVADWCDYFTPPPIHHSGGGRLTEDQLELLVAGHGELGMRSVAWSIGRSWVEYHSRLPQTTRFPCAPLNSIKEEYQRRYHGRTVMINQHRPLESAIRHGRTHQVSILPWLSMQRHYGDAYGGIFSSEWFKSNPQWRRVSKNGSVSSSTVCYHFEDVREERVRILNEVARKPVDAVVVGCCRQVPMLLYHPDMVEAFQNEYGFDPRRIDARQDDQYRLWIAWRADRFTDTLRELRKTLAENGPKQKKAARIVVRIPSVGLFYNLAQGLDVETWLRERLVDELQVEPLEDCNGHAGDHDLRPYLELAAPTGIPLIGAVNGNTWHNPTAVLKRALGMLDAGVAGIEIYESNNFAICSDKRWLIPLLGQPDALRHWLAESNLEAVFPIWSRHAASGFDNHSFGGGGWTVYGYGGLSL